MEKEEFKKLFEGYLKNTISQHQLEEFLQVMKTDKYDDFVKDEIFASLQDKDNESLHFMDQKQGEIILNKILSQKADNVEVITIKPNNSKKKLNLLFAAASIAILVFLGDTLFFKSNHAIPTLKSEQIITTENPVINFSGRQLVHLPDGSTVLLNDNSSLKYNKNSFNVNTREVTLTGESFFDIKRNEKKVFIVHTGKILTKVLGTAFNINARNSSDAIEVTVTRGKVQVGDTDKIYGIIRPNQQIKVNKNTLDFQQNNNVNAAIVTEWKRNYLILDDINMEEATALISKKYKVQILLSKNIKNCRITASFLNDEDLDHILKVICSVIEINYHYKDSDLIVLEGKGCQ